MKKTLLSLLLFPATFANAQNNGSYHVDKEYAMSATGIIDLHCSDSKVVIVGGDRATAHVKIDHEVFTKGLTFGSSTFSMEITEHDGNLDLRERSRSTFGIIGYSREKYTILLEVPSGASLTVHGDDGNFQIKNIGGSIGMNLDDANTEIVGCGGTKFTFKIGDGSVRMDKGQGRLDIDGNDSDIFIKNGAFTEIHAAINDGKLNLETSLSEIGNYSLRAQDGSVSFSVLNGCGNFMVHHDDGHVSTDGNFKITDKSDDETRLTLSDGKARVDINVNDGRVNLVSAKKF